MRCSLRWLRPFGDHIRAYVPNAGHCRTFDVQRTLNYLRYRLLFVVQHWLSACILIAARRQPFAKTDSAANQFGAPESVEDPRGTFPLFVARVCPSRICEISESESDYENC